MNVRMNIISPLFFQGKHGIKLLHLCSEQFKLRLWSSPAEGVINSTGYKFRSGKLRRSFCFWWRFARHMRGGWIATNTFVFRFLGHRWGQRLSISGWLGSDNFVLHMLKDYTLFVFMKYFSLIWIENIDLYWSTSIHFRVDQVGKVQLLRVPVC